MPTRLAALAFLTATCFAAPALGCPPVDSQGLYAIAAVGAAIPFALVASVVLGVFSRRWNLSFWGWLKTSVASYGAAASAGLLGMYLLDAVFSSPAPETVLTVGLTAPLIGTTAYVMWIRSRRFLREDSSDEGDEAC